MGGRLLLVAWLVLIAAAAGIGTWLYVTRDMVDARHREANPEVRAEVRDASPAEPAPEPPAPVPEPTPVRPPVAEPPAVEAPAVVVAPIDPAPAEPAPEPLPIDPAADMLRAAGMNPVDIALLELGRDGPLPIVGPDGRMPWREYARPFDASDPRPRIALLIDGLGFDRATSQAAVQLLPGEISLAFVPYAPDLDRWISLARVAGHEVLIGLPLEPVDFPRTNPGPKTLLVDLAMHENIERLEWVLSRFAGYVGVVAREGARFVDAESQIRPVLGVLRNRGLLLIDDARGPGSPLPRLAAEIDLPRAAADRIIDEEPSRAAIDARLGELEALAERAGVAVGVGSPYPVTIERIADWADTVEDRGFVLAPVSAAVARRAARRAP